jgi:hypothetical protein
MMTTASGTQRPTAETPTRCSEYWARHQTAETPTRFSQYWDRYRVRLVGPFAGASTAFWRQCFNRTKPE